MSNNWQCPDCKAVNTKSVRVLRLTELRESLGGLRVGASSDPAPRCLRCNYEADINRMLAGEYDYVGKQSPEPAPSAAQPGQISKPASTPGKPKPLVLIAGGALLFLMLCAGIAVIGGIIFYSNRTSKADVPPSAERAATEPADSSVRVTATVQPSVRLLSKSEAEKLTDTENIPFLADLAVEHYSAEEVNQRGDTLTYTIYLSESQPLGWGMGWCTTTQEILEQNFEHIRYEFLLDEEEIALRRFLEFDYYSEDMQGYCRQYYAILTDWPAGEHQIVTTVIFDELINDGWDDYPASTKTYQYTVTVAP